MRVELLGGFALVIGGAAIDSRQVKLRRARALVAMLALAPRQRLRRDLVIEQLWPDLDLEAGQHGLHQAMYVVRRAVPGHPPAGWMTVQQGDVLLCQEEVADVDVLEFENLAQKAMAADDEHALQAALAAYTGDLVPDLVDVEWLSQRRSALRAASQSLTVRLAETLQSVGRTTEALRLFDAALDHDPLQEAAARGVMTALAADGRRSEAIVRYHLFRTALAEAWGTDPDVRTRELYQHLLTRADPAAGMIEPRLPPALPTSFVGRVRELEDVRRLLERSRLVTLVGAGGAGKTRLALELAHRLAPAPSVTVRFVDLSGLAESERIADVVAGQLGLTPGAGRGALRALTEQLRSSSATIILDNCEHLLGDCGRLVTSVVAHCPKVNVLATSREPLGIPGEHVFRVPSLELPEPLRPGEPTDVAALSAVTSVQLFVDRAQLSRPSFSLTAGNCAAVAAVCLRLDGMPLALELAAARVALLEPAEMLARLDDVLSTVGRGAGGVSRHRTLRAALAWSIDLLSTTERMVLARLSVFAGGFTLDAAEAVCAGGPVERPEILAVVGSLVDKSLVEATYSGSDSRYRLLETVRHYCAAHLLLGHDAHRTSAAHCAYYRQIAHAHDTDARRGVVVDDLAELDAEHDNLRAALRWSLTSDPPAGLELAAALWRYWFLRCDVVEGAQWVERALQSAPAPTAARANALLGLTGLNARRGRSHLIRTQSADAVAVGEQIFDPPSLAIYRLSHAVVVWATSDVEEAEAIAGDVAVIAQECDRPDLQAASSWVLAHCALTRENPAEAGTLLRRCLRELDMAAPDCLAFLPVVTPCSIVVPAGALQVPTYEESLLVGRRVGAAQGVGFVLAAMGYVARLVGDLSSARSMLERSVAHFSALSDRLGQAQALNQLGCILRDLGEFDEGTACLEEARRIRNRHGDRRGEWMTTANLALLFAKSGDAALGRKTATECLLAFQAVEDRPSIANTWGALANIEIVSGDTDAALELYEHAVTEFRSQSWPRVEAWHCLLVAQLSAALGDAARIDAALDRAEWLLASQHSAAAQDLLTSLRSRVTASSRHG